MKKIIDLVSSDFIKILLLILVGVIVALILQKSTIQNSVDENIVRDGEIASSTVLEFSKQNDFSKVDNTLEFNLEGENKELPVLDFDNSSVASESKRNEEFFDVSRYNNIVLVVVVAVIGIMLFRTRIKG